MAASDKQGVWRAECTEAKADDYATVAEWRHPRDGSRFLALRARKPVRFCREAVWEQLAKQVIHKRQACKFSPKANEGWRKRTVEDAGPYNYSPKSCTLS